RLLTLNAVHNDGTLLGGFGLAFNIDNQAGTLRAGEFAAAGVSLPYGTTGVVLWLDFTAAAAARPGQRSPLDPARNVGGTCTQLNGGGLTLDPAPTNAAGDRVDGWLTITSSRSGSPGGGQLAALPLPLLSREAAGQPVTGKVLDRAIGQLFAAE